MGHDRLVPIRSEKRAQIVGDHRALVTTPISRHRNVVRSGGIEPLELAGNKAERRCDDDLVDGGRIRTRQDRIAKSAVATARRIRLAGGAWEQQEHRSRRRLGIPFPNPPTTSIPAYTSTERFDGVARPVTARTFAGPRISRTRRTAATNSRGDRSNSGPFDKKSPPTDLAAARSDSPAVTAQSPATGS